MKNSFYLRFVLYVHLVISAACAERPESIAEPATSSRVAASNVDDSDVLLFEPFGDVDLLEIAREVPTYGGHYQDREGKIVVFSADSVSTPIVRRAIQARLANGRIFGGTRAKLPAVISRRADYTVLQLAKWRAAIAKARVSLKWTMVDLDEGKNRVTVGLSRADFATINHDEFSKRLMEVGVPIKAINIIPIEAPTPSAMSRRSDYIPATQGAYAESLVGGLRYSWNLFGQWNACTIGFPAKASNGSVGFISASHCSQKKWETDTTSLSQPIGGANVAVLGQETWDMLPGTCPYFWSCNHYRFSDANFNRVTSQSRAVKVGYLARPSSRSLNSGSDTSITAADPYIEVVGETSAISQGSYVDQIGATSGWTYSEVLNTCVSWDDAVWPFNGQSLRCAYIVEGDYQGGDSGGPVFYFSGGKAIAAGIIAANITWPYHRGVFSKFMYVRNELESGGFTFSILSGVNPPSYYPWYASISGASTVRPGSTCHFIGSSNIPYTAISWKVNGVVVGQSWDLYYSSSSSYLLEVEVTDGTNVAFASHNVTVTSSAGECYDQ